MDSHPLPDASFDVLVSRLATEAALALGQIENPLTKKRETNLPHAKLAVDLLQVLSDKTKGNLTEEEEKLLGEYLYQLRMVYINAKK